MKDSVYIDDEKKEYDTTVTSNKPVVIALTVSVVLILLLNLINTMLFY